jgi:hypothetical protein
MRRCSKSSRVPWVAPSVSGVLFCLQYKSASHTLEIDGCKSPTLLG